MNYLHKKGNNKHNQGGNMKNFISQLFVVCLLFSVVTEVSAQDRKLEDKSGGAKQEIKDSKDKKGGKSKSLGSGKSSSRISGQGITDPSIDAAAPKSGKQLKKGKAKKGFLGRLLGRSSKKASSNGSAARVDGSPRPGSKSGGQTGGKQPSAGGDKQQQPKGPAGEKPGQGQGDDGP